MTVMGSRSGAQVFIAFPILGCLLAHLIPVLLLQGPVLPVRSGWSWDSPAPAPAPAPPPAPVSEDKKHDHHDHDKMKEAHHGGDKEDQDAGYEEHHKEHHGEHHKSNVVICLSETKHKMPDGMEMDGNPCKEACPEMKPADYGPGAKCELSDEAMKAMGDHHGHHKKHGGMEEEKAAPAPAPAPETATADADGAPPHQYGGGDRLLLGITTTTMILLATGFRLARDRRSH